MQDIVDAMLQLRADWDDIAAVGPRALDVRTDAHSSTDADRDCFDIVLRTEPLGDVPSEELLEKTVAINDPRLAQLRREWQVRRPVGGQRACLCAWGMLLPPPA